MKPSPKSSPKNISFKKVSKSTSQTSNLIAPTQTIHIDPKIWGPKMWYEFHLMALQPTENTHTDLLTFASRLPCPECAKHYDITLSHYPIPENNTQWFMWSVFIHNHVNQLLGKKIVSVSEAYGTLTKTINSRTFSPEKKSTINKNNIA